MIIIIHLSGSIGCKFFLRWGDRSFCAEQKYLHHSVMTLNWGDVRKKLDDYARKEMNIKSIQISRTWGVLGYIRSCGNHVSGDIVSYLRNPHMNGMSNIHRTSTLEFDQRE